MDIGRRTGERASVVAGSVWETRMKSDEAISSSLFRSFTDVHDDDDDNEPEDMTNSSVEEKIGDPVVGDTKKLLPINGGVAVSGKRKTWKTDSSDGSDRNLLQIARGVTEPVKGCVEQSPGTNGVVRKSPAAKVAKPRFGLKNSEEQNSKSPLAQEKKRSPIQSKKLKSGSVDEKSPAQIRKPRSEAVRGTARSLAQIKKLRSDLTKSSVELCNESVESGEIIDVKSANRRDVKAEPVNANSSNPANSSDETKELLDQTKAAKPETKNASEDQNEDNEKDALEIKNGGESEEYCKDFDLCQEKTVLTTNSDQNNEWVGGVVDEEEGDELEDHKDEADDDGGNAGDDVEIEKKSIDVEEVNVSGQKKPINANKVVINEVKRFQQLHNRTSPPASIVSRTLSSSSANKTPPPSSSTINRTLSSSTISRTPPASSTFSKSPPPVIKQATSVYTSRTKSSVPDEFQSFPQTQSKLQSFADLIMWRDASKSAFIFGMGTFIIISSAYTTDLNISSITVISYLGLVYLAAIFLYRSILRRGVVEADDRSYVVGEEEAIWLLRFVLPYLNEFLLKLKALFSGDPATTMKMAVLLFVLARCGSSITIWKLAKLGFFGVFTIPKIFTSYSAQLTAYVNFWIRRFKDAWDSCSHKKAVAVAAFTVVWNLSSVVARIWAAFMLFVAFRYYQQKFMVEDDWVEKDEAKISREGPTIREPRPHRGDVQSGFIPNKLKKRS